MEKQIGKHFVDYCQKNENNCPNKCEGDVFVLNSEKGSILLEVKTGNVKDCIIFSQPKPNGKI